MSSSDSDSDGGDYAITAGEANLLSPVGYRQHECGYCKGTRGSQESRSFYTMSTSLTPQFYQLLLARGWRRSGTILYKPDLANSCCAQYTIRLPVNKFHPRTDHRQAINRFNKFILGDDYMKAKERLHPRSKEDARRYKQTFDLSDRVHEAETDKLPKLVEKDGKEITPSHQFTVTLERDEFSEEKFELYRHYQTTVHGEKEDEVSPSGLKRFLCSSPLPRSTTTWTNSNGVVREKKLGSYHQIYRLDGRLVALAVLDLIPQGVSAVYFMYDESIHKWSPGKLSALREANLALEGGYGFYWMGFYIQTCLKMRYKGDFSPTEVLDPILYEWWTMDDDKKQRMEVERYVSVANEAVEDTGEEAEEVNAGNEKNLSLWDRKMPGITPLEDVKELDLGKVRISMRGHLARAEQLNVWEGSELDDPRSVKSWVGELVAAIGVDATQEMVINLG